MYFGFYYIIQCLQHSTLFLQVINAFRVSFDPPIDKSIVTAPNNSDFLNMADASVKRLVKMAKNLVEFKKLDQEDQVKPFKM